MTGTAIITMDVGLLFVALFVYLDQVNSNNNNKSILILCIIFAAVAKGSLIFEGILILVLLPQKVPNLSPEQKI